MTKKTTNAAELAENIKPIEVAANDATAVAAPAAPTKPLAELIAEDLKGVSFKSPVSFYSPDVSSAKTELKTQIARIEKQAAADQVILAAIDIPTAILVAETLTPILKAAKPKKSSMFNRENISIDSTVYNQFLPAGLTPELASKLQSYDLTFKAGAKAAAASLGYLDKPKEKKVTVDASKPVPEWAPDAMPEAYIPPATFDIAMGIQNVICDEPSHYSRFGGVNRKLSLSDRYSGRVGMHFSSDTPIIGSFASSYVNNVYLSDAMKAICED